MRKRLFAVLLAGVMATTTCIPAFAEGAEEITPQIYEEEIGIDADWDIGGEVVPDAEALAGQKEAEVEETESGTGLEESEVETGEAPEEALAGSSSALADGETVYLPANADVRYSFTRRSYYRRFMNISLASTNPKAVSLYIYDGGGKSIGRMYRTSKRVSVVAELKDDVTYTLRIRTGNAHTSGNYKVAKKDQIAESDVNVVLEAGGTYGFFLYNLDARKKIRIREIGGNKVSLKICSMTDSYEKTFTNLTDGEGVFSPGNRKAFYCTVKNAGKKKAYAHLIVGEDGSYIFQEIPDKKWAKKKTFTVSAEGDYAFIVSGCKGKRVAGCVASKNQAICKGENKTKSDDEFLMVCDAGNAHFTPGKYTLYLTDADVKCKVACTSQKKGKCGKNVTWRLEKIDSTRTPGNIPVDDFDYFDLDRYALVLSGSGPTYNYFGYREEGRSLPWADTLRSATMETLKDGTRIMHRVILREVRVGEGITSLGNNLFEGLGDFINTIKFSLPSTLKTIGRYAFAATCFDEKKMVLPNNVEMIGAGAFTTSDLDHLTIGPRANLRLIGGADPQFGAGETSFTVDARNPYLKVVDGVLFSKDGKTLISYPSPPFGQKKDTYTVPSGTTTIATGAFYCSRVRRLVLPKTVKVLKYAAFQYCTTSDVVVKSALQKVDRPFFAGISPDGTADGNQLVTLSFYGNAPAGELTNGGVNFEIFYPSDNKAWTQDVLKRLSKPGKNARATLYPWIPGKAVSNTIRLDKTKISASYSKDYESQTQITVKTKFGEPFILCDSDLVGIRSGYEDSQYFVVVGPGFKGKATITVYSRGSTAYTAKQKKITLNVK